MADTYWIDIIPGAHKRRGDVVGDYQITGLVGKKWHIDANAEVAGPRHRHRRSGGGTRSIYWEQPIFYIPEYGDVAVTATQDEYEIPDAVQGPLKGASDRLKAGDWLNPGQMIVSKNKRVKLVFQKDGNFVLYGDGVALWNAGTGPGRGANRVFMQTDGNLVVYAGAGGAAASALWNSGTQGNPGAILIAQDDGNGVVYQGGRALWSTTTHGFKKYESHSFGGDMVHAFNTVASIAGAPIHAVTDQLEKIPIVGDLIHEAIALDPAKALGGLTAQVLQGERIDRAFLNTAKDQLRHVKEIAPYVQTVMSVVPGVGTGVAAAIAAGTAIAEGRTISDAVIEGLKGAVPGGQLGKAALGAALAITHGDKVSDVVVNAVKTALPPAAQRAVDTAIAAAGGKNVRESVLQAIRANIPKDAQKALDVGIAVGAARNIQSAVTNSIKSPAAIAKLAAKPLRGPMMKQAPVKADANRGYKVAMGALQHRGLTAHSLVALREALPPAQREGFDHAAKVYKNHFTQVTHSSLVRGGVVTRGAWKQVSSTTKGATPGRLVKNGQVINGHFVRA